MICKNIKNNIQKNQLYFQTYSNFIFNNLIPITVFPVILYYFLTQIINILL